MSDFDKITNIYENVDGTITILFKDKNHNIFMLVVKGAIINLSSVSSTKE